MLRGHHRKILLALSFAAVLPALADEGMWTFDNFPAATVKEKYGANIDGAWLDRVRRSTIRLSNCTASFVSPDGLILTNHHCVESCLAELSSKDASYVQTGYVSRNRKEEMRCATQVADGDAFGDDVVLLLEDITTHKSPRLADIDLVGHVVVVGELIGGETVTVELLAILLRRFGIVLAPTTGA